MWSIATRSFNLNVFLTSRHRVPAPVSASLDLVRSLDHYEVELYFKPELFFRDNILLSGEINAQMKDQTEVLAEFGYEFFWSDELENVDIRPKTSDRSR